MARLRTAPPARSLRTAAEAFLDTIGSANTRRAYGIAIVRPSTGSTAARTDSPPPAAPWTRSPTPPGREPAPLLQTLAAGDP